MHSVCVCVCVCVCVRVCVCVCVCETKVKSSTHWNVFLMSSFQVQFLKGTYLLWHIERWWLKWPFVVKMLNTGKIPFKKHNPNLSHVEITYKVNAKTQLDSRVTCDECDRTQKILLCNSVFAPPVTRKCPCLIWDRTSLSKYTRLTHKYNMYTMYICMSINGSIGMETHW